MYFVINTYSDNYQSALKYLKDTEVNLSNILIIMENFNIRDNNWDSSYLHYLMHTDTLREITNFLNLESSMPIIQICYDQCFMDSV